MTTALTAPLLRRRALQLALVPLAGAAARAPLPPLVKAAAAPGSAAGAFFEGVGGRSTLLGEGAAASGDPAPSASAPPFGFS